MKRTSILAVVLVVASLTAVAQSQTASMTAEQVLARVNAQWRGERFHGVISLDVVLGGQTKSHRLEVWSLNDTYALVRVLEPSADAGSGYLQRDDELWYYAPDVDAIRLPSIALGDALFGAGPSLEDLSHGTLSEDYAVAFASEAGAEAGDGGYRLVLTPRADAPVVYGRLEIEVGNAYVIERLVYYDQRGDVLQTATFWDVRDIEGRPLPTTVIIEDAYGDRTIQRIEQAEFGIPLEPAFFSLDTLRSWTGDR
jgi:hypothetical protein